MGNFFDTIPQLIDYAAEKHSHAVAFKIRKGDGFYTISYKDFIADVKRLAGFLRSKNIKDEHVSILGENSYEWVVYYFGIIYSGNIVVPIDKDLTSDEVETILKMSNASHIFYSLNYDETVEPVIERLTDVEFLPTSKKSFGRYLEQGGADIEVNGAAFNNECAADDMFSMFFTSGTTGVSKGVMISHKNIISDIVACRVYISEYGSTLSVLPMHHTFELSLGVVLAVFTGTAISINNSIKHFSQNLKLFKPTFLLIVPLILETIYNNIWEGIRSSGKEPLIKFMIKVSRFLLSMGIDVRKVFFKKVHDVFGGKLENIFCGGAAIDPEVAKGVYDFGIGLNIGYGITECSPMVTANCYHIRSKYDSCGTAISCCEVKIDSPDENGDGEILIKGDNVMKGYYNNPEATAEVLKDGWYYSGDIGRMKDDNFLYITGRKKSLIVLKNGKNIYPEEIESYVLKIDGVIECVVGAEEVHGEELYLKAEIYPDLGVSTKEAIISEIEVLNDKMPFYKRIVETTFRDEEFPKTTTKKIKRFKR